MFTVSPYYPGSAPTPTTRVCDFKLEAGKPIDNGGIQPCEYTEWVPPPDMPESVKAESQKGSPCYYGFEYRDDDVVAYDAAHGVAAPEASKATPSYYTHRKRVILRAKARELGLGFTVRLVTAPVVPGTSSDGRRDDAVRFAWLIKGKFSASSCPTVEKIKSLMDAIGVAGEPRWMVD